MIDDEDRPYSLDPIKIWQSQTASWGVDNLPSTLAELRIGLREWVNHPFFDELPPDTRVIWTVSKEEERVDMTLEFCVFDNTDTHLNAALKDGDDARYEELLKGEKE